MTVPSSRVGAAGVIFDLDGVIIDSERLQYKSYSQVMDRWGVRVTPAEYSEHWIASGRGPEYAVKRFGLPVSPDELRDLKAPVYHEILRDEVTLMPGAERALARLSAEFPVALATNSNRNDVDFVVDRFGIRSFFQHLVTREDYRGAKPEPDAFTTAAARLGLPAAQCVVLEDAAKGVRAANAAGCPVIAIPNEWTANNDFTGATRTVANLDAVSADLIRELTR